MSKTSAIIFEGDDYDLVCCFGAFQDYCFRCAEKGIVVDIYCPNVKTCCEILDQFRIFQNIITVESMFSEDDYYFSRIVQKPTSTYHISMVYEKAVRRALGLPFGKYQYWGRNEIETALCRSIKKTYGKRCFNIVNISQEFYDANRVDVNVSRGSIYDEAAPISIGTAGIGGVIDYSVGNVLQLTLLLSSANIYMGQDSIVSQIALNIGVPCFLVSSSSKFRVKQDAPNIRYSRRFNVTPVVAQKLTTVWETINTFY